MPAFQRKLGAAFVGTSGWTYRHWRGDFFPAGLLQRQELPYMADRFSTVEVNGTFYSLTTPAACARWRGAVPPGFIFTLKASRYITHMLKLKNCERALANFFASGVLLLGAQLGPLLWQLPPILKFDAVRARDFFQMLPVNIVQAERCARRHDARTAGRCVLTAPDGHDLQLRHALEIRHESWLTEKALTLLSDFGIALVAADSAGRHPSPTDRTTDFAYVRLHGSGELYAGSYPDEELARWAALIENWRAAGSDVYVYFDNDAKVHAPKDAQRLVKLLSPLA